LAEAKRDEITEHLHSGQGVSPNAPVEGARSEPEQSFRRSGQCILNSIPVDCSGEPSSLKPSLLEYSNRASVTFRRRSDQYYLAKDALSQVADCGREKLDLRLLMIYFENWMEKYLIGKFVKLVKDDEYLFIRCVNRFMEDYKRVLWMKMKFLQYIDWDLKIDLTLDPKRFMRLEDELIFIGKAWAKLRAWLRGSKIGASTFARFNQWYSLCVSF
jgi:hypothetical protein